MTDLYLNRTSDRNDCPLANAFVRSFPLTWTARSQRSTSGACIVKVPLILQANRAKAILAEPVQAYGSVLACTRAFLVVFVVVVVFVFIDSGIREQTL